MPTIRALPKLTFVQLIQIQPNLCVRANERRRADRHNRRHGLGSPEDCLLEEGSIGVSCEKPTPNAAGIGCLNSDLMMMRSLGNLVRTTRCSAGTPTPTRSFRPVRCGRSKCR